MKCEENSASGNDIFCCYKIIQDVKESKSVNPSWYSVMYNVTLIEESKSCLINKIATKQTRCFEV